MNTPLPMVMPRLVSPLASSRQLSSITTLSPIRILCGWRSTTFVAEDDVAAAGAEQRRIERLAQRKSRARPGTCCDDRVTNSCHAARPSPGGRPPASAYFCARRPAAVEQLILGARDGEASTSIAISVSARRVAELHCPSPAIRAATVPRQRAPNAFAQADLRRVAELGAGAADVEGPALGEEIDAAAVERRLDAERRADRLADRPGDPERPHRQVQPRRRHVRLVGDERHQLVQRRHLAAGEDVGAAGRGRHLAAQPEPLDQVVDVGQVIVDARRRRASTNRRRATPRNSFSSRRSPGP